jgi:hypothetical protein
MSPERRFTWRCLISLLSTAALAAGEDLPASRVAFLGYVVGNVGDGGDRNVSAVLRVSAASDGRPGRWRASRSPDDCGGTRDVDYFDAAEVAEAAASDETTVQVLLPEERDPWAPDVPLFLCLAAESDALVRWLPLGRSTHFVVPPFDVDDLPDAEADPFGKTRLGCRFQCTFSTPDSVLRVRVSFVISQT